MVCGHITRTYLGKHFLNLLDTERAACRNLALYRLQGTQMDAKIIYDIRVRSSVGKAQIQCLLHALLQK